MTKRFKGLKYNHTKRIFFLAITFFIFFSLVSTVKADYSCSYRTWNSEDNLYFQMVTYPDLWDYTHIYFDTTSTEPTSAKNDNENLWNLGTWASYTNSWQDKWCGVRSGSGYDMGCNSNNWPATMPNPVWTFTGVSHITQVYIATGLNGNSTNQTCSLDTGNSTPTPTPISTSTPIPTSAPTPSPTPIIGQILFQDDFETDKSYQWQIIKGAWSRQFVQGSTRYGMILPTVSSYAEVQGGDFNWNNYEFSFDMLPIQGADRNVFFRISDQRSTVVPNLNLPVGYGLHMYSNHMWLQKFTTTTGEEPVSASISLPDNEVTHFRIQVIDNEIKVYLRNDSQPAIAFIDNQNPLLSGRIGLSETTGGVYPTEVWFDNVAVTQLTPQTLTPQITTLGPAKVWIGLKNSDDVGIKFDLLAEVYVNNNLISSGELDGITGGSSGFNNAHLQSIPLSSFSPVDFPTGSTMSIKIYVRNACSGSTHNSGTARLWYNDSFANSQFDATIGVNASPYYLYANSLIGIIPGPGPKQTIDMAAGSKCSSFKSFGTWSLTQ